MEGTGPDAGAWGARQGRVASALLAFEQVAVGAEAARVREAGARMAEQAGELVAALEVASAAAAGVQIGQQGLLTGPALAECAALLARRARDCAVETARIGDAMTRAAGLLADADGEVARDVGGAAG